MLETLNTTCVKGPQSTPTVTNHMDTMYPGCGMW